MSNQDQQIFNGTVWGALFQGAQASGGVQFFGPAEGAPRPHRGQNVPGATGLGFDFDPVPSGRNAEVRGRRGGTVNPRPIFGAPYEPAPEPPALPSVARAGYPHGVQNEGGDIPLTGLITSMPPPVGTPPTATPGTLPTRPSPVARQVSPLRTTMRPGRTL